MEPRIQYAKTQDGVNIAYATQGNGSPLVYLPPAPADNVQAGTDPLDPDSTPQTSTTTPAETSTTTPTPSPTPVPTEVLPTPLPGDANCDGGLDSIDAALVLQSVAGLTVLPCPMNADFNGDGTLDAVDAVLILQVVAGLIF